MQLGLEVHVYLVVYGSNDGAHRNVRIVEQLVHVLRGCELNQEVYHLTHLWNCVAQ